MKKLLLLSTTFLFLFTLSMNAQVISYDYGEGLIFPINESSFFDFDEDGLSDIEFNAQNGKLGIKPAGVGCMAATFGVDPDIGGIRISIFEEGDPIAENTISYFEDWDDLPLYGGDEFTYSDWEDGEAKYIGLLIFEQSIPGWMKIRVDLQNEALVVLSYGYNPEPNSQILVGEVEATTVDVEDLQLTDLTIYPNPAADFINIELELEQAIGQTNFSLKAVNGQQVKSEKRALNARKEQVQIDVSDLASGIYQLVIEAEDKVITKTVSIER